MSPFHKLKVICFKLNFVTFLLLLLFQVIHLCGFPSVPCLSIFIYAFLLGSRSNECSLHGNIRSSLGNSMKKEESSISFTFLFSLTIILQLKMFRLFSWKPTTGRECKSEFNETLSWRVKEISDRL